MHATNSERSGVSATTVFKWLTIVSAAMFIGWLAGWPAIHRRANSVGWPTTTGVVSGTGLKTYLDKPHRSPSFKAMVCYRYSVDGVPRLGTKLSFADTAPVLGKDEGLAWLEENYPVGKQVTVYYDPSDPDLAVLTPGAPDLVLIWRSMTAAMLFCMCLARVGYWNARRRLLENSKNIL